MRIFISAGEPSGDLHGSNLIRTLRQHRSDVECVGFGGDLMAEAGCKMTYPLCQMAIMGFIPALAKLPFFLNLISQTDRWFSKHKPDAVVLIDFPGFNWWVARRARFHGIPVFWFVPPQLWAWAGWRVAKMRRFVDHVLCTLPFEVEWYRQRGVTATWVGHPYFDELLHQKLDAGFLAEQQKRGGPIIGLLPGSRTVEVDNNLATLVRAAPIIRQSRPDVRFLVACYKEKHRRQVEKLLQGRSLPIEAHSGRTPEIIQLAHACVAVSGSVGLELLNRARPSAIIYRVSTFDKLLARSLMTSRFISLVNLLADEELYPEYLTNRCEAEAVSRHMLTWLNDPVAYAKVCRQLTDLRQRVAVPGACARAAQFVLEKLEQRELRTRKAA